MKLYRNVTVGIALTASLVLSGASASATPTSETNSHVIEISDRDRGVDSFRAVFMLQGPLGQEFLASDAYREMNSEQRASLFEMANSTDAIEQADKIVDEMIAIDSTAFDSFGAVLSEESPNKVQRSLKDLTLLLSSTETYKTGLKEAELAETFIPGETNVANPNAVAFVTVVVGLAVVLAAAAVAVVVANFFAGANVGYKVNVGSKSNEDQDNELDPAFINSNLQNAVQDPSFVKNVVTSLGD